MSWVSFGQPKNPHVCELPTTGDDPTHGIIPAIHEGAVWRCDQCRRRWKLYWEHPGELPRLELGPDEPVPLRVIPTAPEVQGWIIAIGPDGSAWKRLAWRPW